jgi:hypothetical protein
VFREIPGVLGIIIINMTTEGDKLSLQQATEQIGQVILNVKLKAQRQALLLFLSGGVFGIGCFALGGLFYA